MKKTLLLKKNVKQTIRFLLNESHERFKLNLTETMKRLYHSCSTLFKALLSPSKLEKISNDSEIMILKDLNHMNSAALCCLTKAYV